MLDLGFVGEPWHVDAKVLETLIRSDVIPVIAPIGIGDNGETFNINADTAAGAVAAAMRATRLLLLTDVTGVLDKKKKLVPELSVAKARALIEDGTISGGMIPKIETCIDAVLRRRRGRGHHRRPRAARDPARTVRRRRRHADPPARAREGGEVAAVVSLRKILSHCRA